MVDRRVGVGRGGGCLQCLLGPGDGQVLPDNKCLEELSYGHTLHPLTPALPPSLAPRHPSPIPLSNLLSNPAAPPHPPTP